MGMHVILEYVMYTFATCLTLEWQQRLTLPSPCVHVASSPGPIPSFSMQH